MKIATRLLLNLLFLSIVTASFAQAPKTLSYQGYLSDGGGPLTGSHNLTFTIYDSASAGVNLWTETLTGVTVSNGSVSLTLGKLTPIGIQTNKPLWMGIAVDGNSEISPRVELAGSLYALGLALPYAGTASGSATAFEITHTGTGSAGRFETNNILSGSPTLNVVSNANWTAALYARTTGLSNAGYFEIANPANATVGLGVSTNGTNHAFSSGNSGTNGSAGNFSIGNATNGSPTIRAATAGTGFAGNFLITNASSTAAAINISHSGTGNAITANRPISAPQFVGAFTGDGSGLTNLPISGLTLPYSASQTNASPLFSLTNSGLGSALYGANTNSVGPNAHGVYGSAVANSNNAGVYGTSVGGGTGVMGETSTGWNAVFGMLHTPGFGWAGNFENTSPSNFTAALHASTAGTGMAIEGQTSTGSTVILASHYGAVGTAGRFEINNAGSPYAGLEATTTGTGQAFFAQTSSGWTAIHGEQDGVTGTAGKFEIVNPSNNSNTLDVITEGGGSAISATSGGNGAAVNASNIGAGDGFAGSFQNSNASNTFPAIQAGTQGLAPGVRVIQDNTSIGSGMDIYLTNPSSSALGLAVSNVGSGNLASFVSSGTGSGVQIELANDNSFKTGLQVTHNGTQGAAGNFYNSNPASLNAALTATTNGNGPAFSASANSANSSFAATFQNTNASNDFPAIQASTLGAGSSGVRVIQDGPSLGRGMDIYLHNPNSNADGIAVSHDGLGVAGSFSINNASSSSNTISSWHSGSGFALSATTGGTGGAAMFANGNGSNTNPVVYISNASQGYGIQSDAPIYASRFDGDGSGLTNLVIPPLSLPYSTSSDNPSTLFDITSYGSAMAGAFTINNGSSNSNALSASSDGQAPTLVAFSNGPGGGFNPAASFEVSNSSNGNPALQVRTFGTGPAANLFIDNASSPSEALTVATNGTGVAGNFTVTNSGNTNAALNVGSNGSGAVISAYQQPNGSGNGINVSLANTGGFKRGVNVDHPGTQGEAGFFANSNSDNNNAVLVATSAGNNGGAQAISASTTGNAYAAILGQSNGISGSAGRFLINDSSNPVPAVSVETAGTGNGINVAINNASNGLSAVVVSTNGTGPAGNFQSTNTGANEAALAVSSNSTSGAPGVSIVHNGDGRGIASTSGEGSSGQFINSSSSNPTVTVVQSGYTTALDVDHTGPSGDIAIFRSGSSPMARVDKDGAGYFNGGTFNAGADLAEMFDVEGEKSSYEPGDVLVVSETTDRTVEKSSEPNSTKIAGVYATKPGVTLSERGIDANQDDLVPMGVVGVIPTKVCNENGPIKRGDLLVTSSVPGYAMKAIPIEINGMTIYPSGALLGKALENFDGSRGLINVLVSVK